MSGCRSFSSSGSADVSSTASAMRYGAVDFLQKPVEDAQLLAAVSRALEQDAAQRLRHDDMTRARELLGQLTPREREVSELVARGLLNKQIAAALGPSLRTIKIHRARMMRKLGAASVADVVRLLARVEPQTPVRTRRGGEASSSCRGRLRWTVGQRQDAMKGDSSHQIVLGSEFPFVLTWRHMRSIRSSATGLVSAVATHVVINPSQVA